MASLVDVLGTSDWEMLRSGLSVVSGTRMFLATKAGTASVEAVREMTNRQVRNLAVLDTATSVVFPEDSVSSSGALAGHSYPKSSGRVLAMALDDAGGAKPIMSLGEGAPCFVELAIESGRSFVWSTLEVFDIEAMLEREIEFEYAVHQFVPAIIFLRHAFRERIWHSPWRGADLVIDDPLITRKYGFLEFPSLLSLVEQLGLHVSVAFIPWNYGRTRLSDVSGFRRYRRVFGVCAHGCDHTKGEFRSNDYADLLRRCHLAADRMELHEARTQLAWERVMVCPREEYSMEGIQALANSGEFLAMSNMGCLPRDLAKPSICAADLLAPMNSAFFGFPILKRYGFSDMAGLALASFLGKPAVLTAHHDDFRFSPDELRNHLSLISKTAGAPNWVGLGELVRKTCQQRRLSPQCWEVRFFADELDFTSPEGAQFSVAFIRHLPVTVEVSGVTVNGVEVPFTRENGTIRFERDLAAGEEIHVRMIRLGAPLVGPVESPWHANVGVAIRRFSSELRDKWLAKCKWALRFANSFMKMINLR